MRSAQTRQCRYPHLMRADWVLTLGVALGFAAGCGDDSSGTASNAGGAGGGGGAVDAGPDAPSGITLRVDPLTAQAKVVLGQTPPALAFKAFAKPTSGGAEQDVTQSAVWTSSNPKLGTFGNPGSLALAVAGGVTQVVASYAGVSANAQLTVELSGDVYAPGTDATSKAAFDAATPDPTSANAPVVEYPEDGSVLPSNLPPIEAQWTVASDSTLYRVRMQAAGTLDLTFYTTARELEPTAADWKLVADAAPDSEIELWVEGVGSGLLRQSAPVKLVVSADGIDESAIYIWVSSAGAFAVLDIINQIVTPLPNDSPALGSGQPCSGCHRVSRDGKRFAYSYNSTNFQIGTLAWEEPQKKFLSKVAPAAGVRGTYAAFNPLESTQRPAMLLTVPDDVPQNTAGNVVLQLVDPDDLQPVPSDIGQSVAQIPAAVGHHVLMPDWSPGGDFVTFVAYPGDQHFVREIGDDVTLGSIVEAGVSYDSAGKAFKFAAPKVLVPSTGSDPDTGQNNLLPAISPDSSAVAFTRANGWWSIKTQQTLLNLTGHIAVVRRSDATVLELKGGSAGPASDWSSTWPQWAPSIGSRYMWLAYASERPYGHLLTSASAENASCNLVQGQKQCKHLWVMAIDKQALASGSADPSRSAFWVPGQVLAQQYVSPLWTKSVLPKPK